MKYFTKHLPVEGEMKEGDKYLHEDGSIMNWTKLTGDPKKWVGLQKVKLFLCSRDIKMGDKVYYKGNIHRVIHKEEKSDWLFIDPDPGPSIDPKELTKVIGEISPDALSFVKEGMEFGEREIRVVSRYKEENRPKVIMDMKSFYSLDLKLEIDTFFIQVKGPCAHFH